MPREATFKRYKEWGRRLRSGRKAGRSGPVPRKLKRRVFYERPENRCEKHHAYRINCSCAESERGKP